MWLGSLEGLAGEQLLSCRWAKVLDRVGVEVIEFVLRAKQLGLLHARIGGGVGEIDARRLAGLALVGRLIGRTPLRRRLDALAVAGVPCPTISHGEVALSMLGLLCLARPDYAAIEDEQSGQLLQLGLGLSQLPSEATLRQRLDQIGGSCLEEAFTLARAPGAGY